MSNKRSDHFRNDMLCVAGVFPSDGNNRKKNHLTDSSSRTTSVCSHSPKNLWQETYWNAQTIHVLGKIAIEKKLLSSSQFSTFLQFMKFNISKNFKRQQNLNTFKKIY